MQNLGITLARNYPTLTGKPETSTTNTLNNPKQKKNKPSENTPEAQNPKPKTLSPKKRSPIGSSRAPGPSHSPNTLR